MNKKQYNNVIEYTLKHDQSAQTEDSLATARAIFNNMGVSLPNGTMQDVYETISSNEYMGWRSCTMQEAQEAADNGIAAIGISEDRLVVLSATDEEEPVAQTASVMTLDESTSAFAVDGLRYYSYWCGTTTENSLYFQNAQLTVEVGDRARNPLRGSCMGAITWWSSNSNVATVLYNDGTILAKSSGTVTITVQDERGVSASYELTVVKKNLFVSKEENVTGTVFMDVLPFLQTYRVLVNMWCTISAFDGERVLVESVSVFTKYDDTLDLAGVQSPSLSIGRTKLGEVTLALEEDTGEKWLSPDWVWDAKIATCNQWVPLGTTLLTRACVCMDSTFMDPYREVQLSTQIAV